MCRTTYTTRSIFPFLLKTACLLLAVGIHLLLQAQEIKWTGAAANGLWRTDENWSATIAPINEPAADIVLDNSIAPNSYSVKITGNDSLVIRSLIIAPDSGKNITVLIDELSTQSLALTVKTIIIKDGGQILNASGASSGTVLNILDSFRINNGGLYSHQTRRAHAALVSRLSRSPGTEEGIFEFNIPSASNTLSLSKQVYGTLRLSNARYGANATYTGGAVNPLIIRGNLEIADGVTFSLNFSDTVFVYKNYLQHGGVLNMANSTRSTVLMLKGDIEQDGGQITKTGVGMPQWILHGSECQQLNLRGRIAGKVKMVLDNPQGAALQAPLFIPYILELKQGKLISSAENLLTIGPGAGLVADSSDRNCFIEGPLKKTGLSESETFCFAIGKESRRPICLKNASGSFCAEYFRGNPSQISSQLGPELDHISSVEYWSLAPDENSAAPARVELSYSNLYSGSITDVQALRVASVQGNGVWENNGNTAVRGSEGSDGAVQSEMITAWYPGRIFTLASNTALQNPLPLNLISFEAGLGGNYNLIEWKMDGVKEADYFAIEYSTDGQQFVHAGMVVPVNSISSYQWMDPASTHAIGYYRLKVVKKDGASFYSRVVKIKDRSAGTGKFGPLVIQSVRVMAGKPVCLVQNDKAVSVGIELFDGNGRLYGQQKCLLNKGFNEVRLTASLAARGIYILRVTDNKGWSRVILFLY